MREDSFRSFLSKRMEPRSVQSYVSDARRVERELHVDLDDYDLSETGIANLQNAMRLLNFNEFSARNCISSVKAYSELAGVETKVSIKSKTSPARPAISEAVRTASVKALLTQYAEIMDELRERKIVRTGNSPVGDFAESLFTKTFDWALERNSRAGHDATDSAGLRYQIKARRLSHASASRQLSALRRLEQNDFDYLAAIVFGSGFDIVRAVIIPYATVVSAARRSDHTNSWFVILDDRLATRPDVRDVTAELAKAADDF